MSCVSYETRCKYTHFLLKTNEKRRKNDAIIEFMREKIKDRVVSIMLTPTERKGLSYMKNVAVL